VNRFACQISAEVGVSGGHLPSVADAPASGAIPLSASVCHDSGLTVTLCRGGGILVRAQYRPSEKACGPFLSFPQRVCLVQCLVSA
jgi:hypothetical protein